MKKYLLALVAMVWFSFSHQFHFSETLMEWQPKSSRIACTIRVFTDDLEKEIELKYNIKNTEPKQFEKAAFNYLQEVFQIKARNGVPIPLEPLGMELEGDVVYLYLESDSLTDDKMKKTAADVSWLDPITIRQTLFFDQFTDQKNLVNLRRDGKTSSFYYMEKVENQACRWP
jgi:predicted DNA binding CopG/RHH family protein